MNENSTFDSNTVPPWIHGMGVAVWVSDESGKIVFMNERAETVLGCAADVTIGQPCHQVIGGKAEGGEKWCEHNCRVQEMARDGEEIEPYTLRINGGGDEDEHWLQLLVIPFPAQDGKTHLAHCAFRIDRTHIKLKLLTV